MNKREEEERTFAANNIIMNVTVTKSTVMQAVRRSSAYRDVHNQNDILIRPEQDEALDNAWSLAASSISADLREYGSVAESSGTLTVTFTPPSTASATSDEISTAIQGFMVAYVIYGWLNICGADVTLASANMNAAEKNMINIFSKRSRHASHSVETQEFNYTESGIIE